MGDHALLNTQPPKLLGRSLFCHQEFYCKEAALSMLRDCLDKGACPNCLLRMKNARSLYEKDPAWKYALPCIICEEYFDVPFLERGLYGNLPSKSLAAQREWICDDCMPVVLQRRAAKRARHGDAGIKDVDDAFRIVDDTQLPLTPSDKPC